MKKSRYDQQLLIFIGGSIFLILHELMHHHLIVAIYIFDRALKQFNKDRLLKTEYFLQICLPRQPVKQVACGVTTRWVQCGHKCWWQLQMSRPKSLQQHGVGG
jgi:hypothetical protein